MASSSTDPVTDGGVTIDDMRIKTDRFGTPDGVYDIRGSAEILNGSAVIGLPITLVRTMLADWQR